MPEEPQNPTAGESETPSAAIENTPSSDAPQTTDLPSTDKPPAAAKKPAAQADGDKPPAKAKKEKAPAVEDKPFAEFIPQENIQSQRAFSCAENNTKTSTLEPFLIDERKITLDLMVFGVVQRLNAQKWLNLN